MVLTKDKKKDNIFVRCFKISKINFIFFIICFLIGLFFLYITLYDNIIMRLVIDFFAFLPCIAIIVDTLKEEEKISEEKRKRKEYGISRKILESVLKIASIIGFIFALLAYYFMIVFIGAIFETAIPITDVKVYNRIIKKSGNDLKKVFPKKIPNDAINTQFYYSPGALQAADLYSLYYIDNSMTEEKMNQEFRNGAIWIGNMAAYQDETKLNKIDLFIGTPLEDNKNNEEDFIIYLMDGRCDDTNYCNHGKYILVAFNEKTKEIIYKSMYW